jgi:hypothetical protein
MLFLLLEDIIEFVELINDSDATASIAQFTRLNDPYITSGVIATVLLSLIVGIVIVLLLLELSNFLCTPFELFEEVFVLPVLESFLDVEGKW